MVGVPGKSKGCYTCRQRRVKCDLRKPSCKRCEMVKRPCGGYQRGLTFINHDADGSIIKIQALNGTVSSETKPSPDSTMVFEDATLPTNKVSPMSLQPNPVIMICQGLENVFLGRYLSVQHTAHSPSSTGLYMTKIVQMPRDNILEAAIRALYLTRLGRWWKSRPLLYHGMRFYSEALWKLKTAIVDSGAALKDTTLAAAKVLHLFEVYEPTSNSIQSVRAHAHGVSTLIDMRGSKWQFSDATKLVLAAARHSSMVAAIHSRQKSSLGGVMWRAKSSWAGIIDLEQNLYDIGFDIGDCVEDICAPNRYSIEHDAQIETLRASTLRELILIDQNLSCWSKRLVRWMPSSNSWEEAKTNDVNELELFLEERTPEIAVVHCIMNYWALRIVFAVLLEKVCSRLMECMTQHSQDSSNEEQNRNISTLFAISHDNLVDVQISYAQRIETATKYCLRPEMGHIGAQGTMFPLSASLFLYRRIAAKGGTNHIERIITRMQRLHEQIGIDFADHTTMEFPLPDWASIDA